MTGGNGTAPSSTGLAGLVDLVSQRLQAGGPVELTALLAANPEHAAEVCRLLPALGALNDLAPVGAPSVLGDFRLIREVGSGGMGVVFEAVQVSLGRRVALKLLPFTSTLDPRRLERFRHEAQAAALLHHPNIVPVHAVGSDRGVHYIAMQFIDGHTLAAVVRDLRDRRARLQPVSALVSTARERADATAAVADAEHCRSVARWVAQAADALDYAHRMGVVHRDVKPANLMVDVSGGVWVTDFGVALVHGHPALTVTGDLLGTLRYMSPEQALARPGAVDHRTDVYSLGCTLYELLTLEPAVCGSDRADVLRRVAEDAPVRPRRLNPEIPRALERVVLKAMARSRNDRYASAGEFADDLRRFLDGRPVSARRGGFERLAGWVVRHRRPLASLAAAVALAAGVVFAGRATLDRSERETTEQARRVLTEAQDHDRATRLHQTIAAQQLREVHLSRAEVARRERQPGWRTPALADLRLALRGLPPEDTESERRHVRRVREEYLAGLGDPTGIGPFVLPTGNGPSQLILASIRNTVAGTKAEAPDGRWRAEWDATAGEVRLTEPGSERVVGRKSAPLGAVLDLKVSADARLLLAGCERGLVVWGLPDLAARLVAEGGPVRSVAVDPRGRLVAALGRDLDLWSVPAGRVTATFPARGSAVAFSPNGKLLISVTGYQCTARPVRDTPEKTHLDGHMAAVTALAFGPGGKWLASASDDRTVRLWDTGWTSAPVWDTATGSPLRVWANLEHRVDALAFTADGRYLAGGDARGVVRLWDVQTGAEVPPDNVTDLVLRPADGTRAAHPARVAAHDPEGRFVAVSTNGRSIGLSDRATGAHLFHLPAEPADVCALAWSPGRQRLAVGLADGGLAVWDIMHVFDGFHRLGVEPR